MGIIKTIPAGSPYHPSFNDVGTVSNHSGNTFEVSDIDISSISKAIGHSSGDIGILCTSNNINMYALFRPNKLAPYNFEDWGGYNHEAKAPTHFVGKVSLITLSLDSTKKITLPISLDRGERPPYLDNAAAQWNYVNINVKNVGGSVTINKSLVANAIGPSNGSYNPSHVIELTLPDNDFYNLTLSVEGFYSTGSSNIKPIEDTHPNISLTIAPQYILVSFSTSTFWQVPSTMRHIYQYTGIGFPDQEFTATNNQLFLDNSSAPSSVMYSQAFRDSIPATRLINGNYYVYKNSTYLDSGVWRTITFDTTNPLSVGSTYRKGNVWYKVNSIQSGYLVAQMTV